MRPLTVVWHLVWRVLAKYALSLDNFAVVSCISRYVMAPRKIAQFSSRPYRGGLTPLLFPRRFVSDGSVAGLFSAMVYAHKLSPHNDGRRANEGDRFDNRRGDHVWDYVECTAGRRDNFQYGRGVLICVGKAE